MGYPPHLMGRITIAAHRIEEMRMRAGIGNMWVAHHADHKGLNKYLSSIRMMDAASEEITPEESKRAAIGLMTVLGMG